MLVAQDSLGTACPIRAVCRVNHIACQLCKGDPCVAACPRDVLLVRAEDGTITLDRRLCTGWGWCIEACEFRAIALAPSTKSVVICNPCRDLPKPRCVESSLKKALSLAPYSAVAARLRKKAGEQPLSASYRPAAHMPYREGELPCPGTPPGPFRSPGGSSRYRAGPCCPSPRHSPGSLSIGPLCPGML